MQIKSSLAGRFAGTFGLAMLLSLPGAAFAQRTSFSSPPAVGYGAPDAMMAIVQSSNRHLNYLNVRSATTGQAFKVDVRRLDSRQSVNVWTLRPGDRISVTGRWENGNTFQANSVNPYSYQPMTSAYGAANLVNGIVENTNRRLNYVTVRNQQTGQLVKIDVRSMNTRQSVNVWRLRPGDRIVVDGTWENRDTFRADRVNF